MMPVNMPKADSELEKARRHRDNLAAQHADLIARGSKPNLSYRESSDLAAQINAIGEECAGAQVDLKAAEFAAGSRLWEALLANPAYVQALNEGMQAWARAIEGQAALVVLAKRAGLAGVAVPMAMQPSSATIDALKDFVRSATAIGTLLDREALPQGARELLEFDGALL